MDVGCGSGQSTFVLTDIVKGRIVGSDVSPAQIEEAAKERDRRKADNIEFRVAPGETLDAEDGSVDIVTTCQVIKPYCFQFYYDIILANKGRALA